MSLFAEMATRFATSTENLATEAVAHLCHTSAGCRAALVAWAADGLVPSPAWSHEPQRLVFDTQHTTEDGGIPDLVGKLPVGRVPLMIEAKFDAGLTDNQPSGYLPHLPDDGVLAFLVPTRRRSYVHAEVVRRLHQAGHEPVKVDTHTVLVGGRTVRTDTWTRLLARMERAVDPADEPQVLADVHQLQGLATRMDDIAFVPLLADDLSGSTPLVNRRVSQLHEALRARCRAHEDFDFTGLRTGSSHAGLREVFWFRYRGLGLSVAWDDRFWADQAATPWWVGLWEADDDHPGVRTAATLLGRCQDPDDPMVNRPGTGPIAPVHLPPGLDRDAAVEALFVEVRHICDEIAAMVLAGLDEEMTDG